MNKVKRKIIKIDEEKCNGCGNCIPDCPEGALQLIDGKARLLSDLFCDGLGACIGSCPADAISVEEREAQPYDETKVMENIVKAGTNTIKAHLKHLNEHGATEYLNQAIEYLNVKGLDIPDYKQSSNCDCPGSKMIDRRNEIQSQIPPDNSSHISSQLRQWPIQIKLLNPHASYFKNADVLLVSDCVPFAYANFHNRFLKDSIVIIFCPKLDSNLEGYVEKLTTIMKDNDIKSITVVRMEVPCCGGITKILEEALKKSGKNIIAKEYVISLKGDLI